MTTGYRVTQLRITDYRGIEALDVAVPPAGIVVEGGNAQGKTSVLNGLLAALTASGVGADSIRIGKDQAEIFVELDGPESLTVRRTITADGQTLRARQKIPGSKQTAEIKQRRLNELFPPGVSPMALFQAKPEDRRKIVMSAVPMKVTPERLSAWLTEEQIASLPRAVLETIPLMHGLEAIEAIHGCLYELRAAANRETERATRTEEQLAKELSEYQATTDLSFPDAVAEMDRAFAELEAIEREVAAAVAKREDAEARELRTVGVRQGIAGKREKARYLRESTSGDFEGAADALQIKVDALLAKVRERECELATERLLWEEAVAVTAAARKAEQRTADLRAEAATIDAAADEMEATLAQAGGNAPTIEDIAHARGNAYTARQAAEAKKAAKAYANARDDAKAQAREVARAKAHAAALTATVDFLRKEAGAELLAASDGIPGLGLDDGRLTLDGVSLDLLSGAEQLTLCVEVAKRSTMQRGSECRVLVADKLEALDPEQFRAFIDAATRDGWQLLATRVTGGDLHVQAITREAPTDAPKGSST